MKQYLSKPYKVIVIFLIVALLLPGYILPKESNASTVEKMVTKYHLDIGVEQVWGIEDKYGNIIWNDGIGQGSLMKVSKSISLSKDVYNVKVYQYNADKFNWDDAEHYSSNVGSKQYYDDNYADYASNSITITNPSSSGKTVSFSYSAVMNSTQDYDLAKTLRQLKINEVFRLMAGPYSTDPEGDVRKNFPSLYNKLNKGRNGVDSKVHAYMYFTPVIIQYDVKEMIEIPDPEPESIIADLVAPTRVKTDEKFNLSDATRVGDKTIIKSAELYRTIDGETELIATWLGKGQKGENTGGIIQQEFSNVMTITYELVVTTENGLTDTITKKVIVDDGKKISGQVELRVNPNITHEGHPVDAYDCSTYTIEEDDGTRHVSAKYAYEEGLASNSYRAPDGKVQKDKYDAIVTFPKKGIYPITLRVRLKGSSERMTDTKNVEVLKTPYIYDTLSGFQKQNRKQILTFKIATYPGKPITDWNLAIKDLKSNELAYLNSSNLSFIGDTIKTRKVKVEVLDEYWTQITVEFLTKYPRYSLTGDESQNFSYKLKIEDSKGDKDDVYKGFLVTPDVPPIPKINMQSVYTRNQSSDYATIEAECLSESDGDSLDRTWSVAKHNPLTSLAEGQVNSKLEIPDSSFKNAKEFLNYKNIGFGTDQKISFDKRGVGLATIKLHLKDIWTEPTLEEFIKPSDYLESDKTEQTEIVNIAPVVSIEPLDLLKANIIILTNKARLDSERKKENELNVNLIENNIDGSISINGVENNDEFNNIDGYRTLSNSENYQYVVSNTDSTLIRAYDIGDNRKWKYNIEQVDTTNIFQSKVEEFCVDQKENYGILISKYYKDFDTGRRWSCDMTILNAKTGVPIKTYSDISEKEPDEINVFINNNNNILYIFIKPHYSYSKLCGIWKIDLESGNLKVLDNDEVYLTRLIEGKIAYIKEFSSVSYGINYIDLKSEQITSKMFPRFKIEKRHYIEKSSTLKPVLWDSFDTVLFESNEVSITANAKEGTHFIYNSHYYNYKTRENSFKPSSTSKFVLDKMGRAKYYYFDSDRTYYDKRNIRHRFNTTFYSLIGNKVVSWEECQDIVEKINNEEYFKEDDEERDSTDYKLLQSLKKYTVLNMDNTYLKIKDIGKYGERVKEFINNNGIRLINNADEEIGESVNVDLKEKTDYALRLKGDKNNIASVYKKLNLDSGKTYRYSYDMNTKAGTDSDLLSIVGTPSIATSEGKTYYKEIVYKEDYTRGDTGKSPFVEFNSGVFNSGSYFYGAGYGGTKLKKNSHGGKGGVGGPSMTFHLEKDGYIDISFYNDAGNIYIYIDGVLAKFNQTPSHMRILKILKAGEHTFRVEDSHNYNEDPKVIETLEIGYIFDDTNINQSSTISKNNDGSKHVEGSFKVPNDILYTTNRSYAQLNQVIFDDNNTGVVPSDRKYKQYGFKGNLSQYFELTDISDSRKHKSYITPYGNGVNFGGRSDTFDLEITNPTNNWMITSFQWGGTRVDWNNPKITCTNGECQELSSSRSGTRGGQTTDKIYKVWYIIPPKGSGKFHQNNSGSDGAYGGWWSMYNMKYGFFNETSIKQFISPNIKLDDATKNGFFCYNPFEDDHGLTSRNITALNVIDFFSLTDGRVIIDKYTNLTPDSKEILKMSTEKSTGIDTYISNLTIKEKENKYGCSNVLQNRNFNFLDALNNNEWIKTIKGTGVANIEISEKPTKEDDTLIYKKGQLIKYGINYSDYEKDPSKCGYWLYAHTPYNDGEHSNAAIIYDEDGNIKSVCGQEITTDTITLDEALNIAKSKGLKILDKPIDRFYVDGKYTVYHWQYDDTSRKLVSSGYPKYDKASNTSELTFYIQGSASAPWITGISTSPSKVKENNNFSINIGIDDVEKDVLSLTTEVYKDKKLIYTHRRKNIYPLDAKSRTIENEGYEYVRKYYTKDPDTNESKYFDSYKLVKDKLMAKTGKVVRGFNEDTRKVENIIVSEETEPVKYPVTNTGALPDKAQAGKYEVVCTVRDQTGAGLGTYKFIVVSEGKITGEVYHTEQWDINRKKYNINRFNSEINRSIRYAEYIKLKEPRTRGINVFWSGEKFMLSSEVSGKPTEVTCSIKGTKYETRMKNSGKKNAAGEAIYTASLWDKSMINKWGRKEPVELTFIFTATYSGNVTKKHEVKVIVDNMDDYWKLHRVF